MTRPSAFTRNSSLPSDSEAAASAMDNWASSFWMVPKAAVSPAVTSSKSWSVTLNVSSGSCTSSGFTATSTLFSTSPGANVRLPAVWS